MAIDISKVFRTNVKAIRMSLNADGKSTSEILNEEILGTKKAKIAPATAPSHVKEAAKILSNITLLKNFLNENKEFYIQPNYLLSQSAGGDSTSQIDFQNFEDQAESIIGKCANAIRNLKSQAGTQVFSQQYSEHLDNVFYLLEKYFREVCKVYSEQKAIRVKRLVERKNQSQLCSKEVEFLSNDKAKNKNDQILNEEIEKEQADRIKKLEKTFTEQELLSLEKENETLYEHLSMQSEEVKKIESQVIEVSRLTEIFTENITSQLTTVNSIQKSTVETNSNLTIGNESIKEAMRKNAALRLWILFIIIVLSFTLLFLDWYND